MNLNVSYITHHTRMISASAVLTCAANTETQLIALKISHSATPALMAHKVGKITLYAPTGA